MMKKLMLTDNSRMSCDCIEGRRKAITNSNLRKNRTGMSRIMLEGYSIRNTNLLGNFY